MSKTADGDQSVQTQLEALQGKLEALEARDRERCARERRMRQELAAFEHTSDGIVITDLEGRIVDVNPAAIANSGFTLEECRGRIPAEIFQWTGRDSRARLAGILLTVLQGERWTGELRGLCKNGTERVTEVVMVPLLGEDGSPVGTMGLHRDVTARVRAEEALRKSEEQYRLVVDHANEAIVVAQDGKLRLFNPKAVELTGYSEAELTRIPFAELVHPEDRDTVIDRHARRLQGEEFTDAYTFRILTRAGAVRWLEIQALRILWDGRPATLNFLIDVTDRKRAQEDLWIKEKAIASSINGIALIDTEGVLSYVNSSFLKMWGFAFREEVIGQQMAKLWIDPAASAAVLQSLREEGAWIGELTARRADAATFEAQISASLVTDESGRTVCCMASFLDVTEPQRLEEQLRQSRKMEAVGRLAGGVAHDFNNILTAIQGFCELVLSSFDPEDPRRRDVEEIQQAGLRGSALVRQLLAFSRKQVLQHQPLDVNQLVANVTRLLQRVIGEHVELQTRLDPDLVPVRSDRGQLEQVLVNLAANAADAMPDGGLLSIETSLEPRPGPCCRDRSTEARVVLTVSDTGCGIEADILPNIFDPFFTTKRPHHGTGLGLSTVYGIVEQSGGTIEVDSAPGKGTSFRISLPAADAAPVDSHVSEREDPVPGGVETIWVVEDEESVRRLVRRSLSERGYTVIESADPLEALRRIEQHEEAIHVLVTDVVMPGLAGPELADRLRIARPQLKVLYISGYPDRVGGEDRLGAHADFLAKPFAPEQLAGKVRKLLGGSPEPATAALR